MPRAKIKVASPSFSKHPLLREELLKNFPDAVFNDTGKRFDALMLVDFLKDAEGAIVGLEPVNREVIDALPGVQIFSKYGVGLDNVDVTYAESRGRVIGWVPGVNRRSVSELALGFMLGLARNIFFSGLKLKAADWDKAGGFQLTGKTVGIIGCGFVGEDVLRLLQPFHARVLINDIVDKSHLASCYGAELADLDTLLKASDFVTVHVPCTDQTREFINADKLSLMKPTAYLINTSRGGVVDQKALKAALQNKKIGGAGLDVFAEEPPTDREFLSLPNLFSTPHIGGNAEEAVLAMGRAAVANLVQHFSGR